MGFVNAKEMMQAAKQGHYAVGHFNLNNMESVRAFLLAAEEAHSPIILGVSGGTAKYMGGYRTITHMVKDFIDYLHISVPVCLHVDHGTYKEALAALEGGFSSIMFDGSKLPVETNLEQTKRLIELCHRQQVTIEAEVGAIGGEEDGRIAEGECADPMECKAMMALGVDMLAAGIGNIHGKYPADWQGLHFDVLEAIQKQTGDLPLVLHGGSGIPNEMVREAIRMGITKVNVNTECQLAFTEATRHYIEEGKDRLKNGFTPRNLLAPGLEATMRKCTEKMELFGSVGKA